MASNSESEQILEMAIAGISRVAQAIAAMPAEDSARALEAAERSYCQTAREFGYGDAEAESWAAALMFKLRRPKSKSKSRRSKGCWNAHIGHANIDMPSRKMLTWRILTLRCWVAFLMVGGGLLIVGVGGEGVSRQ